jgi:hypothetical protein
MFSAVTLNLNLHSHIIITTGNWVLLICGSYLCGLAKKSHFVTLHKFGIKAKKTNPASSEGSKLFSIRICKSCPLKVQQPNHGILCLEVGTRRPKQMVYCIGWACPNSSQALYWAQWPVPDMFDNMEPPCFLGQRTEQKISEKNSHKWYICSRDLYWELWELLELSILGWLSNWTYKEQWIKKGSTCVWRRKCETHVNRIENCIAWNENKSIALSKNLVI